MNIKKYVFGNNIIYEIEELDDNTFDELENMVTNENTLISIYKDDFKSICNGYNKLMIGLGKTSDIDSLLNLFDLYKDTESLILQLKGEVLTLSITEEVINKVKDFFNKNTNIIFGVEQTSSIYDLVIFVPIIRKEEKNENNN